MEKKSDSSDEDKSLADSKVLVPVLKDFFQKHPLINPKVFLGDADFDSIEIYKYLLQDTSIEKAYIPLNGRMALPQSDCTLNENGIPCCPKDPSLPMKREGSKSYLRCSLPTMKFVCPKMKWEYNKTDKSKRRVCHCANPCTSSSYGRMFYIYPEKNCVPIPAHSVVRMNGIPPIKSEVMLKNSSTISRIAFVSQGAKHGTKNVARRFVTCRNYSAYYRNGG